MNNENQAMTALAGTWISKKSGAVVKVKNFMNDGDRLLVVCDDGSILDGQEFSNNWFQVSDDNKDIDTLVKNLSGTTTEQFQAETVSNFDAVNINKSLDPAQHTAASQQKPLSNAVLDKIFAQSQPTIDVDINMINLPVDALNVAVKYLDVSIEDINNYIKDHIKLNIIGLTLE